MTSSASEAFYKSLMSAYQPFPAYPYADPLASYGLHSLKPMPPPMAYPLANYAALPPSAYTGSRAKAVPSSGECRDPYCTSCPPVLGADPKVPGTPSPTPASSARPYVCNWIVGDNYCGKKFPTSDDLLQHLRTHTNLSSSASSSASTEPSHAPPFGAHHHPLLPRNYPTPPLSPLSAARYHPYSKGAAGAAAAAAAANFNFNFPALLSPAGAGAAPPLSAVNAYSSLFHPALAPYYSHLSQIYGHRIGAAPLPP